MNNFKRVYHPYTIWEEIDHNMWGYSEDKKKSLSSAICFMGNHRAFGKMMLRVVNEWYYSCENSLTDANTAKRAWIGQAACALALKCPENITREAWSLLTDEQRVLANKRADEAIRKWEENYAKSKGLRFDVGEKMLF